MCDFCDELERLIIAKIREGNKYASSVSSGSLVTMYMDEIAAKLVKEYFDEQDSQDTPPQQKQV
jgi:hypothetical protein